MESLIQKFDKKLNESMEWVFFDFFDTIVHRRIHTEAIKRKWCEQICRKFQLDILPEEMYEIRKQAEYCVSHEKAILNREYSYRELCDDIYLRLMQHEKGIVLEQACSSTEFYASCLSMEEALERDNLYIDTEVKKCINLAKQKNKKTAIISDFYLPKDSVMNILRHFNLDGMFQEYFISCDYGLKKSDGKLYQTILNHLDIKPCKCLMLGDNCRSDYRNAKRLGINAVHYKCSQYAEKTDSSKINNHLLRIADTKSHYSNYAFSLYLFLERLYRETERKKIKNILFLSREGQYLKKIFQYYLNINKTENEVELHYFYTSRIASYTSGLQKLEDEDFHTILNRYPDISVNTFLLSIGFTENQIEAVRQFMDSDINYVIKKFSSSESFQILLQNKQFKVYYDENRTQQKKYLEEYLQQLGIKETEDLYLVDVGWRGTIQDNLFEAFDRKRKITGYYIGISKVTQMTCNNVKIGLLFSEYPIKTKYFDVWNFDKFMYERILLADHPTTVRYKKENEEIKPVFKEYNEESKAFRYISVLLDEIFVKIKVINEYINYNSLSAQAYELMFVQIHLKMVMQLDRKCLKIQKRLYLFNYESFGEFSKTKIGNTAVLIQNLQNISFRRLIKNGLNLKYISGISFTTFMINRKFGFILIPFLRLLYKGELKRIRKGECFEYE